jgi:hypothetical protein
VVLAHMAGNPWLLAVLWSFIAVAGCGSVIFFSYLFTSLLDRSPLLAAVVAFIIAIVCLRYTVFWS